MKRRTLTEMVEGLVIEQPSPMDATPRAFLDNGRKIQSNVLGIIRRNYVRAPPGDRATVQLSPNDSTEGRTIYRPSAGASSGYQYQTAN
uniref:Translational initiation factor 1 n=1 Tax=Selaginella moellendorffii TaxID=88036 RepID=F4YZF1_SELML|nr:translational initiation factor 1 [Selaginella moellendorffii]